MTLCIYDLDKTLTKKATFTPFLIFAAWKTGPTRLFLLPFWALMMVGYKLGLYRRATLKTLGMRLLVPLLTKDQLEQLGAEFASAHLQRSGWNDEVVALLQDDKAGGRTVVIATAAFSFYATAFASKLGVEHVVGTIWDGRSITGANCYGNAKLERVKDWAGAGAVVTRMVSDSFADAPLLFVASDPVYVTNSHRKACKAERHGWRVLRV